MQLQAEKLSHLEFSHGPVCTGVQGILHGRVLIWRFCIGMGDAATAPLWVGTRIQHHPPEDASSTSPTWQHQTQVRPSSGVGPRPDSVGLGYPAPTHADLRLDGGSTMMHIQACRGSMPSPPPACARPDSSIDMPASNPACPTAACRHAAGMQLLGCRWPSHGLDGLGHLQQRPCSSSSSSSGSNSSWSHGRRRTTAIQRMLLPPLLALLACVMPAAAVLAGGGRPATVHGLSEHPSPSDAATAHAQRMRTLRSAGSSVNSTPAAAPRAARAAAGAAAAVNYELPGTIHDWQRCINAHQPQMSGTNWRSAMRDRHPRLKVVGVWSSSRVADVPLTIATQLSWNRKWQLKAMCRSWRGPIAAVMHVPVLQPKLSKNQTVVLEVRLGSGGRGVRGRCPCLGRLPWGGGGWGGAAGWGGASRHVP